MTVVYILEVMRDGENEWEIESVHKSEESAQEKLSEFNTGDLLDSFISEWEAE